MLNAIKISTLYNMYLHRSYKKNFGVLIKNDFNRLYVHITGIFNTFRASQVVIGPGCDL